VFDQCLRLLHPFIPFVTEETWQQIRRSLSAGKGQNDRRFTFIPSDRWPEALIIAEWPTAGKTYPKETERFENLRELVRNIRSVRAEYKVDPGRFIEAIIATDDGLAFFESQREIISFLARIDQSKLSIGERVTAPESSVTISLGEIAAYLPLAGMIDLDKEKKRLELELKDIEGQIKRLTNLLASDFAKKAPTDIVQKEKQKLNGFVASREEITERLSSMK
jgi:valyl-tRNA synthetase